MFQNYILIATKINDLHFSLRLNQPEAKHFTLSNFRNLF